ncbi:MAG: PepSY domain-containing protein [Sphingomonas sp.]
MRYAATGAIILLPIAALANAAHPAVLKGARLAPQAKVTLATARTAALKVRPGVITDQELERESGGSGLRYSFDIKSARRTYEVGIDAKTGAVLENSAEGAYPD